MDIYPTLVELCSLPKQKSCEGESMVNLLKNPESPGPETAISFTTNWGPSSRSNKAYAVSLRTDRYRYVEWRSEFEAGKIIHRELYDHSVDSGEINNLAKSKGELAATLQDILDKRRSK